METVGKFKRAFDGGETLLTLEVMAFLRDWLTKHILSMDKESMCTISSNNRAGRHVA